MSNPKNKKVEKVEKSVKSPKTGIKIDGKEIIVKKQETTEVPVKQIKIVEF